MFKRVHDDELVETAKVESVATDSYGIPHVKFKVSFSRPNRFSYDEGRSGCWRCVALRIVTKRVFWSNYGQNFDRWTVTEISRFFFRIVTSVFSSAITVL